MSPADARRGLARFGFAAGAQLVAIAIEGGDAEALAHAATDRLSRAGGGFLISRGRGRHHVARCPGGACPTSEELGAELGRNGWAPNLGSAPGPRSRPTTWAAACARRATPCRSAGSRAWASAGFEQLGTYRLLLSMADPDALARVRRRDPGAAGRLRPRPQRRARGSLRAFLRPQRPLGDGRGAAVRTPAHAPLPDAQGGGAHRPRPRRAASTGWSSGSRCGPGTSWRRNRRPELFRFAP